ncbi:MAG TPA: anthranilate synthase component I [Pseudoclavibacter sp.]|nr:anthranilate synthase component I [Pseudoclavibacter sp.]
MNDSGSYQTTPDEFQKLIRTHRIVPVVRRLFADSETPMGVYRKLGGGSVGSFLLESSSPGGMWTRFSFVGVNSYGLISATDAGQVAWTDLGLSAEEAFGTEHVPESFVDALQYLYRRWQTPRIPGLPSFTGGLVGYFGWEAVRLLEKLPNAKQADYEIPAMTFSLARDVVVIDHRFGTVSLVANVLVQPGSDPEQLWDDARARLDQMQLKLSQPSPAYLAQVDFRAVEDPFRRTTPEEFRSAVEKAKEYIRAGDIFQVVIGQRFELDYDGEPLDVYRVLRTLNPSPYMYLLNLQDAEGTPFQIVGASPEALVKVSGATVITHPIAGSRPRGATVERDAQISEELLADTKERAEHLMLVDLARNDLLKVCEPGSVDVTEFMQIERFSHIMHIVSSVQGTLSEGFDSIDVFRATFPAGTLSGAPKPRAMEIIDELEPSQRGLYGGVVGYFDFAGDSDLAIAIRTAVLREGRGYVQAGGGIVADSVPQLELEESQNKAAAALRAIAIAKTMIRIDGQD